MVFAVSPGSEGSGPERYVAYLPFVLAPGASIGGLESFVTSTEGSFILKLEKLHHLYAVSLGPFASTDEAAAQLERLRASLMWFSLHHGVGVSYSNSLGDVKLFDEAIPVTEAGPFSEVAGFVGWAATDGYYDSDKALIRPDHKRLTRWEPGRANFLVGISVENCLKSLQQALSLVHLQGVIENERLRLAIELYAAYRFELSDNAQLITLVTALESLLPDMEIPDCSKGVLAQIKEVVRKSCDEHPPDSYEWSAITRLLSRVSNLKSEAIGATLRHYISTVVSRHPELGDSEEVSGKLREVYKLRSLLLHTGNSEEQKIKESLSFLREFVKRLLATLYHEAAVGQIT